MTTRIHRRDILKLFGVGASIIPIIGGQPVLAAEAKLIEEPKIEPINLGSFDHSVKQALDDLTAYANARRVTMAVLNIDALTGKRHLFTANALIPLKQQVLPPVNKDALPVYVDIERWDWRLEGTVLPTPYGDLNDKETLGYIYSFA